MTIRESFDPSNTSAKVGLHDLASCVKRSLNNGPASLDQLWVDHAAQWHQLGWNATQLSLWLSCLPGLQKCLIPSGETAWTLIENKLSATPCLTDELVALLHQAGRPMPLAQLMTKLPAGMVVTEPMLRKAAQQDERLELKGPILKLA